MNIHYEIVKLYGAYYPYKMSGCLFSIFMLSTALIILFLTTVLKTNKNKKLKMILDKIF